MPPRLRILIALGLLILVGGAMKLSGVTWLANSVGGVLWVLFFAGVGLLPRPRRDAAIPAAGAAFGLACLVEISQLADVAGLESIRRTFPGRLLVGTTFAWSDFVYYALGAVAAWCLARRLTAS